MSGKCSEHILQWFSVGHECPVCKLERQNAALEAIANAARALIMASKTDKDKEWARLVAAVGIDS